MLLIENVIRIAEPKYYPTRQRFTTPPPKDGGPKARGTPLVDGKSLADYNINDGDTIFFKDLGPQVCARQKAAQHCPRYHQNVRSSTIERSKG